MKISYICRPVGALGAAPSNPPGWKRSKGTKLSARCAAHLISSLPSHFNLFILIIFLSLQVKNLTYCLSGCYLMYNQIIEIFF